MAQLTYREGYYADKEFARYTAAGRERHLEEALMLEDPITEITLALEVNVFQINSAEYFVPVAVKIPGSELTLAQRRGAARTEIDVIGEVKDDFGITVQNMRDRLDIRLDAATAGQLASQPLQYETGFSLLPGRYVLKLLVRDLVTGRIGTYETAFAIPNLMREDERGPCQHGGAGQPARVARRGGARGESADRRARGEPARARRPDADEALTLPCPPYSPA